MWISGQSILASYTKHVMPKYWRSMSQVLLTACQLHRHYTLGFEYKDVPGNIDCGSGTGEM